MWKRDSSGKEFIRQRVGIDEMQYGFMLGCGTTDAIFTVHQEFIWLAMPTLGTDEWLVHLVRSLYKDVRSRVKVGDGYCQ